MSLGFITRGYGLAAPSSTSFWRATLLALLADLVWYVLVWFCLGRGCWVGVTMIASGLLNFCRCCALRLEGNYQVEIISICVSSEGRIMPCTIFSRLPASACTSRHAPPPVPCWVAFIIICPTALCLLIIILCIMGWLQPASREGQVQIFGHAAW